MKDNKNSLRHSNVKLLATLLKSTYKAYKTIHNSLTKLSLFHLVRVIARTHMSAHAPLV